MRKFLVLAVSLASLGASADFRVGDTVLMPKRGVGIGEIVELDEAARVAVVLEHAYPGSANFDGKWTVPFSAIFPTVDAVVARDARGAETEFRAGQTVRFNANGRRRGGAPRGRIVHVFEHGGFKTVAIQSDEGSGAYWYLRGPNEVLAE